MKKDIVIYSAGGFAREVAWLIEQINQVKPEWNFLGYLDDNQDNKGMIINGYPVLGSHDWFIEHKKEVFSVCAIGNPIIKKKIIKKNLLY